MLAAAFHIAYPVVKKHEGGYVNDPADIGGETYMGIARRFWPDWSGWFLIDTYKAINFFDPIPTNATINMPGLQAMVESFFKARWDEIKGDQIENQQVATNFYDFYILASRAVATMQEVLNSMGESLAVDNRMGSLTLAAINRANATILNQRFTEARRQYHIDRVEEGKVSSKFLPGWLVRASFFDDGSAPSIRVSPWVWIAGAGIATYAFRKDIKKLVS